MTPRGIERAIMKLLEQRHPRTVGPSDVARLLDVKGFRRWLPEVLAAAGRLSKRGRLDAVQRGKKVDPAEARGPIRLRLAAAVEVYRRTDFRRHPERYRVGRGEQGVLTAEPYKSELLPLWRFRTEADAKVSAEALLKAFRRYRKSGDFVGMDMARKFLQMGFTRARRYANHRSGRKYDASGAVAPRVADAEKARAALVFHRAWQTVEADARYRAARVSWGKRAR